jgi:FkbM family methyltransferase
VVKTVFTDETLRRRLGELLGPDAAERCAAVRNGLAAKLRQASKILVYGAGRNGRSIAGALRAAGLKPSGFLDDTPSKQGTEVDGLPIGSSVQGAQCYGPGTLVVVSMFSPGHSYRATRRRLSELGFDAVMSVFEIAACLPDDLLPFYYFDRPQRVLASREGFHRLFDCLIDRRSKEELLGHLAFRLYLDVDALPQPVGMDYGYLSGWLPDDVVFVDGGAFDGDSVQAFLRLSGERFGQVIAFEPDELNFRKLRAYRESLPTPLRSRVEVCNAGLWSESTRLRFDATGTLGSALSNGDGEEVAVVSLDDYIDRTSPLFVKFDVEGAERNALLGAQTLLRRGNVALAVAVYHQPDDLWSLAALLQEINPSYEFGLRSHMDDGTDLMLYAVPRPLQISESRRLN